MITGDINQSVYFLETEYLGKREVKKAVSIQVLTWPDPSKISMEEKTLGLIFFLDFKSCFTLDNVERNSKKCLFKPMVASLQK